MQRNTLCVECKIRHSSKTGGREKVGGQPFIEGEQKPGGIHAHSAARSSSQEAHRDGRAADANCYIGRRRSFFRPTLTARRNGIVNREVNAPSLFPEH